MTRQLSKVKRTLEEIRKEAEKAKKDLRDVRGNRLSGATRDNNRQSRGPGPLG